MLSFITEILLGFLVLGCALVWGQHEIDLKAIVKDFKEVKTDLEELKTRLVETGVLKTIESTDRGGVSCPSSRNASGNGGHRSGRP